MSLTAKTYAEAREIAATLRALYAADGYRVEIVKPLFDGDTYRVNAA